MTYATGTSKWNTNFPVVGQGTGNNSCWTTYMTSILKGNGINTSIEKILKLANKTSSDTGNFSDVQKYFKDYFSYSSDIFNEYSLVLKDIASEINTGRALHQELYNSKKSSCCCNLWIPICNKKCNSKWYCLYSGKRVDCTFIGEDFKYSDIKNGEGVWHIKK